MVTLHDVQHLDLPDFFSRAERELRRFTYDRAAQRADLVVTVSEFCKTRIHDLLDIPFDRIRVARLGVSPFFHPDRVPKEDFVIYPARRDPHKNHERLLEAMHRVRDQYPGLRLVLTGGGPDLPQVPDWVEQRGQVSVEELRSLYQRAQCMVFPSLYEGFGMPPLEAMASGCQIAVSTAGSLPEVCGDVGVTFNPKSVTDIARGIETALASPERDGLRGLDHARGLTWGACAEKHVEAFRSVVKRGPV